MLKNTKLNEIWKMKKCTKPQNKCMSKKKQKMKEM